MGRFEDYIEAVTRRLRPDPELHMDVAREVRAHLEDAAEEARARGLSDEEAAEAALAAFGEADEIAGALWEANRGRMRLRAVLKWAARGTLLPAALLVAVYICITYFGGLCQVTTAAAAWDLDLPWPGKVLPRWGPIDLRPRGNLSPEERLEFKLISRKRSDAEALLELDPLDPSFHAHYVLLLARDRWNRQESLGAEEVKETLAVLKRARSIEPDNAYYNYLAASLLMERSSMLDYNGGIGVKYTGRAGQEMVVNIGRLVMDDPVTFEQGVSELFEGMSKPYYSAHTFDMVRRKISLAKPPTTLADELRLWFFVAATPLPHLASLRAMGRRVAAYSALLAQEGRHEEAIEMIEAMDRPGVQMGAGAQTVIELSTSQGHIQMALGQAAGIYERMDMQDRAALAQQRSEMESERWNSIWRKHEDGEIPQENLKHYGFVHVALAPSLPGVDHSLWGGPSTALEHILAEGLALAVLEVLLLLLALRCAVATCWNLWRYRKRADGPKLFFIGWRRMAGIVLLGLVLPIGVYAAYSRLAPFSSMRYGIHYRLDRVLIEKGTLVALVLIVVLATSYRAIRARCRDAGMDVPSEGFFNPL